VIEGESMKFKHLNNVNKTVNINNVKIGEEFAIIAGPCSVESREQMDTIGQALKKLGIKLVRGGAFKPRTTPDAFQGLKKEGIDILVETKNKYDLAVVSELTSEQHVELFDDVDVIQIGARNMQNYELLKRVGQLGKPVILKRSPSASITEWIHAAEYIISEGNNNVILCERGIKSFEFSTRYTLDLSSIPVVKSLVDIPIIVDPSHAAGNKDYVIALSKAAKAVGADGLLVEVHPNPEEALSDVKQQITVEMLEQLMKELEGINV